MILALKWVKQNIYVFSGDKNRVTIFGESSGGVAVSLLMLSQNARGLFHRAIIQSGTATCPYVFRAGTGIKYAKRLGQRLQCPKSTNEDLVACLQLVDVEKLEKSTDFVGPFGFNPDTVIHMGPTLETYRPNDGLTFITKDPWSILQSGHFIKIPVIIGMTSHETKGMVEALLLTPARIQRLNSNLSLRLSTSLLYYETAEDPSLITKLLQQYYFNRSEQLDAHNVDDLERLFSERSIVHCTRKYAAAYANYSTVYAYNYTKKELVADVDKLELSSSDPPTRFPEHSEELQYLFYPKPPLDTFMPKITEDSNGFYFSRYFVSLWTTFARDGAPSNLWGRNPVEWTPLKAGQRQEYLQLDEYPRMTVTDERFENSWKFWDDLPLKEYGKI